MTNLLLRARTRRVHLVLLRAATFGDKSLQPRRTLASNQTPTLCCACRSVPNLHRPFGAVLKTHNLLSLLQFILMT
jgi:hypothetical protein